MTALELLLGSQFEAQFTKLGLDVGSGDGWLRWHMAAETRLPPVSEIVPTAPPIVARLIDRLLAKQVSERPGSASEARQLLAGAAPAGASSLYPKA